MLKIPFVKYHGAGNDFIMIDDREGKIAPMLTTAWVARACHRHFGIGADGMILIQTGTQGADFFMKYYNSDGHTSSFCGNGGRCVVAFAASLGMHAGSCTFLGTDGWHSAQVDAQGNISLSMIDVHSIQTLDEKTFILDTGSPHYIHFGENIHAMDVRSGGSAIRYSEAFDPKGINVNFVEYIDKGEIKVRTYERGVENETLACGTGVVASAIAAAYSLESHITSWKIHAVGGDLQVTFEHESGPTFSNVKLIGPAVAVFTGDIVV